MTISIVDVRTYKVVGFVEVRKQDPRKVVRLLSA